MKISTYFEKKKVMFSLLLIIALVGIYFAKVDLTPNKTGGFISALYSELSLKKLVKLASKKFSVLGQVTPLFFFPQFPQRLMYVASNISEVNEELVSLNEKLLKFTKSCDCKYAESQCKQEITAGAQTACKPGPVKVFGEPCPISIPAEDLEASADPEKLEEAEGLNVKKIQEQIENTSDELSFLQELLKTEMESGLEKQLQTLRPDDAQALRDNLEKLLELGPKIAEPTGKNLSLPDECSVEKCSPNCKQGGSFTLESCLKTGIGEQKPMEAKFGAGVGLDDLKLGKVGIKNINLSLPEEIEMPNLPELPSLTISIPDIIWTCQKSITFQTPAPALPNAPTLTLSCPQYPSYSPYQCATSPDEENKNFVETEWYFQTFSWLTEKCQELPSMKDGRGIPKEGEIQKCFDKENVHQTIIQGCDDFWSGYIGFGVSLAPSICKLTGEPCLEKARARERECKNIFTQEGESAPSGCNLDIKCSYFKQYCGGTEDCYATDESINRAIETLGQKCEQIKQSGRETIPEPCKFLPLFTGKFPVPEALNYEGPEKSCPAQEIGDYPNPVPGCSLAFPSAPKISFPKIIIPDIRLPSFNFPPFFSVKLPNFIFEDLALPDLDLCNLDDCQFQFPYLRFKIPTLRIPKVEVPPVQIPNGPEVKVAPIEFRPLSFKFPQLFNLGSLATPELKMPSIPLPQPKLQMSFKGIKIDLLNILLGLLKIPSTLCASLNIKFAPINISYPDYIFSWPAFPRVPEIPFCQNTRQFCKDANGSIQEVTDKTTQIQNQVNAVFQNAIQGKLDQLGQSVSEEIKRSVQEQFNQRSQKIQEEITKHLATYAPEYAALPTLPPPEAVPMPGVLPVERGALPCEKIPPLTIPMEDIVVPSISLADLMPFPDKIPISWPADLKKIALSGDLGYELPTVPLSGLSYLKDVVIRLPGLQRSSPSINFNLLENATACMSQPPSGGNPCPTGEIQNNLEEIKRIRDETQQASQKIIDILY